MSRGRLALVLFGVFTALVLAVGMTRSTNEDSNAGGGEGSAAAPPTVVGVGGELAGDDPILQPVDEVLEGGDDDCRSLVEDQSPSCEGFEANGVTVVWAVEQEGETPPIASLLRREDGTWRRVLTADGAGDRGFDLVNVRLDDLDKDGVVEIIFGFHRGNDLGVDVADATGTVLLHLDVGTGQVLVGSGMLVTWERAGDRWTRKEIGFVDGKFDVITSETVDGPAGGNL